MEASKAGDYGTLRSLLNDEAVLMLPDEPWILGAEQLEQMYQHMEEATSDLDIPEYTLDFEEVAILGEYAFEWGNIRCASQTENDEMETKSYTVMRILKKTAEGE